MKEVLKILHIVKTVSEIESRSNNLMKFETKKDVFGVENCFSFIDEEPRFS